MHWPRGFFVRYVTTENLGRQARRAESSPEEPQNIEQGMSKEDGENRHKKARSPVSSDFNLASSPALHRHGFCVFRGFPIPFARVLLPSTFLVRHSSVRFPPLVFLRESCATKPCYASFLQRARLPADLDLLVKGLPLTASLRGLPQGCLRLEKRPESTPLILIPPWDAFQPILNLSPTRTNA